VYAGDGAAGAAAIAGGGGSGAGSTGTGNAASGVNAGSAKSELGGAGGNGGVNSDGFPGNNYGGAGGGGERQGGTNKAGGAGAAGFIRITYQDPATPSISNVLNSSIEAESVTISWNTNIISNTSVNYGTTTALGTKSTSSSFTSTNSRAISSLTNNTLYYYNVTSCDAADNCNTSGPYNFSTLPYGYLSVSISAPSDQTNVNQNASFVINATITCEGVSGATCGVINATVRINTSSSSPDTQINTTTPIVLTKVVGFVNLTHDLSATDPGNWWSGFYVTVVDGISDEAIYLAGYNGNFGVFNLSSNVTTDLKATDPGDWMGSSHMEAMAVDHSSGLVYMGSNVGTFGVYNSTTNVLTDLSATDTGDWIGTNIIRAMAVDPNNGLMYIGLSLGGGDGFGVYNRSTNVLTDLSSADPGDWLGASSPFGLAIDASNGLVYVTVSGGMFGVYNSSTGVLTDLSATDTDNWMGTKNINEGSVAPSGLVYLAADSGQFGVYNRTTNVLTDLSATDTDNWIGNFNVHSVEVDPYSGLVYFGTANGDFGVYNRTTNITTNLNTTDPSNWMDTDEVFSIHTTSLNRTYLGLAGGKLGLYEKGGLVLDSSSRISPSLTQGESYIATWTVSATGTNDTQHLVDVLFNSTTYSNSISVNSTVDREVCIGTCPGEADVTDPIISAVLNDSITATSVNITWATDENANSSIEYGTTISLGTNGNNSASLVTSHGLLQTGLDDSTLYYYNVTSCDASANCATSGPYNCY